MSTPFAVFLDGVDIRARPSTELATSRGLHYGDGVFRTVLKFDDRIVDLDRQLAKLAADAVRIGLDPPSAEVLRQDIGQATQGHAIAAVKLLLVRNGASRGYRTEDSTACRLVMAYPAPKHPVDQWIRGIVAFRSPVTMASQPLLAGIKHLNRLEQVLAARDWQADVDEGILCTADGAPVCGTRSNLFWIDGRGLHTPALTHCGVAGVMRDRVLEAAGTAGIPISIADVSWTDLMSADEAFMTNSLIGIWPLRSLDGRDWTAPGPVTARLSEALAHPRLIAP